MGRIYIIEAAWSRDERGWVVTSPDIPGLVVGAFTERQVAEKVRTYAPAMIEIGVDPDDLFTIRFTGKARGSQPAETTIKIAA